MMKKKKSVLEDETSYFSHYRHNDLEQYRLGYPGKKDYKRMTDNWKFYCNELRSYPDGDFIDNIHKNWWGDYERLERHHGYVQWLFPIRETGMNFHAQELQMHEIEKIMDDEEAFSRVLKSYEMLLDFYGMKLDRKTGRISRAQNWRERFNHLNRSYHNYLRITRILKFLGEFGHEQYKRPFVEFVLEEAMEHGTLGNTLESCVKYWLETIKSDEDRKQLREYIRKMEAGYNSPDDGTDDKDLVSNEEVEKMIEKSRQNQEDLDKASNKEWEEKEEKIKKNSQKRETKSEETTANEATKKDINMDIGNADEVGNDDTEKADMTDVLKAEKDEKKKESGENETEMEIDPNCEMETSDPQDSQRTQNDA
ncbi:opioid growth factor receptor-like protein 1 isoform X2 [Ostrea edulis]|uniref:opioid growth factor receptor-like protein 1 isoform X2 n=1 Tax=Ostrea edulis TaxID=37623 RepID=UPI0024AFA0D8|nr:opioid growth factor receptor-like protein 1 isoform X2 [Ostrea edulis]